MKQIKEKFNNRNALFAIVVMSLIAVVMILSGGIVGLLSVGGIGAICPARRRSGPHELRDHKTGAAVSEERAEDA